MKTLSKKKNARKLRKGAEELGLKRIYHKLLLILSAQGGVLVKRELPCSICALVISTVIKYT